MADKNIRIAADFFGEFIMRFERNSENKKSVEPIAIFVTKLAKVAILHSNTHMINLFVQLEQICV